MKVRNEKGRQADVDEITFLEGAQVQFAGRKARVRVRKVARATTSAAGMVRLAADSEETAGEAVQANDARLDLVYVCL